MQPKFCFELGAQLIYARALNLNHPAATEASEVIMLGRTDRLIMLAGVIPGQVTLFDQPFALEDGQGPVHGRQANVGPFTCARR